MVIPYLAMQGDWRGLTPLLGGGHSIASTENLPRPAHQPVDAIAMASVDLIGDHQLRLVAERDAMPQPGSRARHGLLALRGCSCLGNCRPWSPASRRFGARS